MPDPISGEWLEQGLNLATALNVLRSWTMRRTKSRNPSRRYVVTFRDGSTQVLTAGQADTFILGIRETLDVMDPTRLAAIERDLA